MSSSHFFLFLHTFSGLHFSPPYPQARESLGLNHEPYSEGKRYEFNPVITLFLHICSWWFQLYWTCSYEGIISQVTLGGGVERCLSVAKDLTTLIDTLPNSLDLAMMPCLPEEAPPIIRCGDRSVAEEALSSLAVSTYFVID